MGVVLEMARDREREETRGRGGKEEEERRRERVGSEGTAESVLTMSSGCFVLTSSAEPVTLSHVTHPLI